MGLRGGHGFNKGFNVRKIDRILHWRCCALHGRFSKELTREALKE
jgi:hypothetical protein